MWEVEKIRYGCNGDGGNGMFSVPYKDNKMNFQVIASSGEGWDHISVSLPDRCPTWEEMEFVKRLFFKYHEIAWEYHMPEREHINIHPNVLHIWRKQSFEMPTPPRAFV